MTTGKYQLASSENLDGYLEAAGVGAAARAAAAKAKPVFEISGSGDKWTVKLSTALKTTELSFTLGQEFDETTADDRKCKSTITKDGNKFIQVQKIGDDTATTTREFNGDEMKATFTTKGVTATAVYKKIG